MSIRIASPKIKRGAQAAPVNMTYRGGPLLSNVEVTTIYWGSSWLTDPLQPQLDAFFNFIVSSSLVNQLSEYSVPNFPIGPGQHIASYIATTEPPAAIDDSQFDPFIRGLIGAVPQVTANSLYFVFTPPGITVTLQNLQSCRDFCGYHSTQDGQLFYAVIPYINCGPCQLDPTLFNSFTIISSHELSEAITDPIPGQGWYDDVNGEIGDICEGSTKTISQDEVAAVTGPSFDVSVSPTSLAIDGSGAVGVTVTFTPQVVVVPPPNPPPPTQSYAVQKEWSNVHGGCI